MLLTCCGQPGVDPINDCPMPPTFMVTGAQWIEDPATGPRIVPCVLTVCAIHKKAVQAFQAEIDPEACVTTSVDQLWSFIEAMGDTDVMLQRQSIPA